VSAVAISDPLIAIQGNKAIYEAVMSQKTENTDEKMISQCGELCDDGTRCERRQRAETCYLHDPDREVSEDHGGVCGKHERGHARP